MSRAFAVAGGLVFVGSLLFFVLSYAWRFDNVELWSWARAWRPALVDLALFSVFAGHHSIFARTRLRTWIEQRVPAGMERSIYVWIASVLFLGISAAWRPVPGVLWHVSGPGAALMRLAQLAGGVLAVVAARRLDPLTLAGVRQAFAGTPASAAEQRTPDAASLEAGPYAVIRHPIYLGWFLMVWCSPLMNGTRLLFVAASCLYILVAIPFEERDLRRSFGPAYAEYSSRVRWKLVPGIY
jgi:protein-S-isoprenylcysteine O-methyltransferase Ste14